MIKKNGLTIPLVFEPFDDHNDWNNPLFWMQDNILRALKDVKRLKLMTDFVDYKCDFNKEGICHEHRYYKKQYGGIRRDYMCCCNGCYTSSGYLRDEWVLKSDLPIYERHWTKTQGFWGRGKGCKLPRELRSITCLQYNCRYKRNATERDNMFDEAILGFSGMLRSSMRYIQQKVHKFNDEKRKQEKRKCGTGVSDSNTSRFCPECNQRVYGNR